MSINPPAIDQTTYANILNNEAMLSEVLQNALSPDPSLRNLAEKEITNLADFNLGLFLLGISSKISNEATPKQIRQISATIIKNMIANTKYTSTFISLNPELKQQIKTHILSTLASSDSDIRKTAGIAIAGICKVELPHKQWNDIFGILVNTSQNENLFIQLSSVITLGYIFQEVNVEDIPQDAMTQILNSFYTLLNSSTTNIELQCRTLESLDNFLPFISPIITNEQQRVLFFDLVRTFTTHQDEKVRNLSLKIFLDIARRYYDYLDNYLPQLIEFTTMLIQQETNKDNIILSYDIWYVIATIEKVKIEEIQNGQVNVKFYKLCEQASDKLLPCILRHLIVDNVNVYSSDEWTLDKGANTMISILSTCCPFSFTQSILTFIGNNCESTNEHSKHAAFAAYDGIINDRFHNELIETIQRSIDLLINIISDPKEKTHIKKIAAVVIQKIAKEYGSDIAQNQTTFAKLYSLCLFQMKTNKLSVALTLAYALHFLVKSVPWFPGQDTNILSGSMCATVKELMSIAFSAEAYNKEYNVAMACFCTLGSLFERAATDTHTALKGFFDSLMQAFTTSMDKSQFKNEETRKDFQNSITSSLASLAIIGAIDDDKLITLFDLIITSFHQENAVSQEGIGCIGSIATSIETKFGNYMERLVHYLLTGLQSRRDASLCKASIICTSEIIRNTRCFGQYIDKIFPSILEILVDPDTDQSVKPHAFIVISDLFFMCTAEIAPRLNSVMNLIGTALQAALSFISKSEDLDSFEYFLKLRECLIESITCIFTGLSEIKRANDFKIYIKDILEFIHRINSPEYAPSKEIMKSSIGLVGDFCKEFGSEMKPLLNIPLMQNIMNRLTAMLTTSEEDKQTKEIVNWANNLINQNV